MAYFLLNISKEVKPDIHDLLYPITGNTEIQIRWAHSAQTSFEKLAMGADQRSIPVAVTQET